MDAEEPKRFARRRLTQEPAGVSSRNKQRDNGSISQAQDFMIVNRNIGERGNNSL
jgi:hypothetical protein